ncbi:rRNA maturation RNase YbeY [Pelagibacteraceae bacterium]|nr:rRNA maturation RNase YbeY [Pelagibacteraceae bacterium]
MIKVDVLIKNRIWKKYIKNPENYLKKKIKILEKKLVIFKKKKISFSILLTGSLEIKKLNKKFRNKNKSTDVLSFPSYEKKELKKLLRKKDDIYLGDIIININKIKYNENKIKLNLDKLWIHGFLHLFGYRHKLDKDYLKMNKIEKKYLNYIY